MNTLVSIAYSPWSRRAASSLRLCGVPFRYRNYIPTVSEPRLRVELRKPFGKITVPVLLPHQGAPIADSFEIAQFAAREGDREFFPESLWDDTRELEKLAEVVLSEGRIRTTKSVLTDDAALKESLPPIIAALGAPGLFIGKRVAAQVITKYPTETSDDERRVRMSDALTQLDVLRSNGYCFNDRMTFADLVIAYSLEFVKPSANAPVKERSRAHWTDPELAAEFSDLLAWRDERLAEIAAAK